MRVAIILCMAEALMRITYRINPCLVRLIHILGRFLDKTGQPVRSSEKVGLHLRKPDKAHCILVADLDDLPRRFAESA